MLKNKKVLITGSNGGIGTQLCRLLENEGALLTKVVSNKNSNGFVCDLSNVNDLKKLETFLQTETFDIVINLAGVNSFVEFNKQTNEEVVNTININLTAAMLISKAALNGFMLKQNKGHIVNVGSVLGLIPMPFYATYSASKAGLKAFSEALYRELGNTNIKVSYIAPRAVETKINSDAAVQFMQQTKTNIDTIDTVAQEILNVIKKPKPRTIIGKPESIFAKINAVMPTLVDNDMFKKLKIAKGILQKEIK